MHSTPSIRPSILYCAAQFTNSNRMELNRIGAKGKERKGNGYLTFGTKRRRTVDIQWIQLYGIDLRRHGPTSWGANEMDPIIS